MTFVPYEVSTDGVSPTSAITKEKENGEKCKCWVNGRQGKACFGLVWFGVNLGCGFCGGTVQIGILVLLPSWMSPTSPLVI
jgi:hypothetical protein